MRKLNIAIAIISLVGLLTFTDFKAEEKVEIGFQVEQEISESEIRDFTELGKSLIEEGKQRFIYFGEVPEDVIKYLEENTDFDTRVLKYKDKTGFKHLGIKHYLQSDPRWGNDKYGRSNSDTVSQFGCALTSLAMVLNYYGYNYTPGQLNKYKSIFDSSSRIIWDNVKSALGINNLDVSKSHYDVGEMTYNQRVNYLFGRVYSGQPVILGASINSNNYHFVVLSGVYIRDNDVEIFIKDPGNRFKTLREFTKIYPNIRSEIIFK